MQSERPFNFLSDGAKLMPPVQFFFQVVPNLCTKLSVVA